jgi:cAMP-binding proteins - catabolite gene activator and regulatory subunit of cAMP-dependent protein kinases
MIDQSDVLFLSRTLPFWKALSEQERQLVQQNMVLAHFEKGEAVHSGGLDCRGMLVVKSGRLRVYIVSEAGREATLYRPVPGESCVLAASCILNNIDFDVFIDAEVDSKVYILPVHYLKELNKTNREAENFTNQVLAARFSDVMWVMEAILFSSMDKRLALFLLDQADMDKKESLAITHEAIAGHLGSAREVVSRMLKYFEREGLVSVSRGGVRITDFAGLRKVAGLS